LIAIVAATVLVSAVLVASDTGPNLPLIAALCGLVGAGIWAVGDVAEALPTTRPTRIEPPAPPAARGDRRLMRLRSGIAYGRADGVALARLHENLVAIVDDQLLAAHDIDRSTDPDGAAAVMGPELNRFVTDPESTAKLADQRSLDRLLTLIERL
jgi:hypothetical protein